MSSLTINGYIFKFSFSLPYSSVTKIIGGGCFQSDLQLIYLQKMLLKQKPEHNNGMSSRSILKHSLAESLLYFQNTIYIFLITYGDQ